MRLLIDTWRAAWGYKLPFFWMQLHGWGSGGNADEQRCMGGDWRNGRDLNCQVGVRLGQADVAADPDLAGTVGLASAVDACEADFGGDTCNLHPGWKSTPAARLAAEVVRVLFPSAAKAHAVTAPPALVGGVDAVTLAVAAGGGAVAATAAVASATALLLQPIHDWKKIFGGVGCHGAFLVGLNATLDGGDDTAWINGTLHIVGGGPVGGTDSGGIQQELKMAWKSPFMDHDGNVLGANVTAVHGVAYLPMAVATCVVANAAGQPLGPFLSAAKWP